MNRLSAGLIALVLLFAVNSFAQGGHTLQLDDGLAHYLTLKPAPLQTGNFTFFLPAIKSDQTILSQGIGSPTVSKALLWGGNLNGTGSPDPVIPNYGMFGTIDGTALNMITANTSRLTIDASGNTTITGGNTTINEAGNEFVVNGTGGNYAAKISASGQKGLEVHCKTQSGTSLDNTTHFVDFFDGAGSNRGSIQGQNSSDYTSDPIFIANTTVNAANIVVAAAELIAAAASAATVIGIPEGVGFAAQAVGIAVQIAQFAIITGIETSQLGVSYSSSAGDYAEYLKRDNSSDKLYPGDIVGVKNGLISKNTEGAQNVYSISLSPIVLGNVPPKGEEAEYNKVGFLGQVPVKVRGAAHEGDFIIASGLNDGIGVAVSSENITPEQFTMVIGRAWTSSELAGIKYIKVAVGLNAKAMSEIMSRQQKQINTLNNEVGELRKTNLEASSLKTRLEKLEQYISNPATVTKQIIYKN